MKKLQLLLAILFAGMLITGCSQKNETFPIEEKSLDLKNADLNNLSDPRKTILLSLMLMTALIKSGFAVRNEKIKGKAEGLLKKFGITEQVEEVYETGPSGIYHKISSRTGKKTDGRSGC